MAIEEALQIIDQSWTEIEPRLTVRELAALAAIEYIQPIQTADLSETVFGLVAPALPSQHAAWSALLSSRTRFAPGRQEISLEEVISRYIEGPGSHWRIRRLPMMPPPTSSSIR